MILENKTMLDAWLKAPESSDLQTYVVDSGDTAGFKHLEDLLSGETLDPREAASEIIPEDLATIIYTSGTTGPPKGVMLSHENVLSTVLQLIDAAAMNVAPGRRTVSYLPMAHIAERMMSHYQPMLMAYEVSCCGDANLLPETLRESRPQILFGVPRVWEKIKSKVESVADLDPERSKALREAVQAASDIKQRERDGELREDDLATLDFLDDVAFKTVRELVGLDSLEYAVSGAAALPVDVLRWFEAIGVPMSEIYGMSESSGPMTWSPLANKPGYVGSVIPKGEIKIAEDGEVLYRGPNVFVGYWGDAVKTEEVLKDGWLVSGDIGEIDVDGYLRIVDRKKELIVTSGGKNISPSNLESEIRGIPLVGQAAVIGDDRPYCVCVVSLDPEHLEVWSQRSNMSVSEALESGELHAEISRGIDSVNEKFSRVEQIKKFEVVREFWTPGDELLTPTSKIKRRGVLSKYREEIEALYK
jgi:long-chain acyl-CoA synthetase